MSWQTILDQLLKMVGVPTQWTGVIQIRVLGITVLGIIAQSTNWALRVNADTGLFKTRPTKIKERLARIDEQLETVTEQNSGMVPLLKSEQDLLLFEEMSGIQAKPALRKKLVYLHEISPSTFTWKALKHTAQYISEETPDVQIKMILLDKAWGALKLILALFCLCFALLLLGLGVVIVGHPSANTNVVEGFVYGVLMLIMAKIYFHLAAPDIGAWRLQRWYRKYQKNQEAERARATPNSSTSKAAQQS